MVASSQARACRGEGEGVRGGDRSMPAGAGRSTGRGRGAPGGRAPAALEAELARCRGWQAEWRRRAEKAEAALAHQKDAKGARLFQLAKRRFAEKYHPDKVQGGRLEKQIYHEMFTDVWKVFEDVEKGGYPGT